MQQQHAKHYAKTLIQETRPYEDLAKWAKNRKHNALFEQFVRCSYSKKPDLVAGKMRKASGGIFARTRVTSWTKTKRAVVMDSLTAMPRSRVYSTSQQGNSHYSEGALLLTTGYYSSEFDECVGSYLSGPTLSFHAIKRLLERDAANATNLRKVCYTVMSRARDAAALLASEEEPFSLMLPYGLGAICAEIKTCTPTQNLDPDAMIDPTPVLSIRTYLSENELRREEINRIAELEDFYNDGDYSDVSRYREILLRNARPPHVSPWDLMKELNQAA